MTAATILYDKLRDFRKNDLGIPQYMHSSIVDYVVNGIQPGYFLTGIITNNLHSVVSFVDGTYIAQSDDCLHYDASGSSKYLPPHFKEIAVYITFFYNDTPPRCWGSQEKMLDWMGMTQKERDEHQLTY